MEFSHLGGHCGITHIDIGALNWLRQKFPLHKTFLDIGCGPGGQVESAERMGFISLGIDGDYSLLDTKLKTFKILFTDLTKVILDLPIKFDIIWCVEVAEHIDEKFTNNLLESIKKNLALNGIVIFTACHKEGEGIHHVNIKSKEWWINKFQEKGLCYFENITNDLKKSSTMTREFIRDNGMIFLHIFNL